MKAIYKKDRQKGIELQDLPIPEISGDEILIKVKAAAVCGTDIHLYNWNNWCEKVKAKNPMIIGHEFCGEVVKVGPRALTIKEGDLVAVETHIPCCRCMLCQTGKQHICQDMKIIGVHVDGAFAEYAKIPEVCAYRLPKGTPPEIGAIYEPFGIAAHGVLKGRIGGSTVVIFGCGPIGLFALSIASSCGAKRVFAVDTNEYRLKLAEKMGDTIVTLNAANDDIVSIVKENTKGLGADVAIEISGSIEATKTAFRVLRKAGWISLIGLHASDVPLDLVNDVIYKEATIYGITGREMYESWYLAESLIESGKCNIKDVLTHTFPLEKTEEAILTAKGGDCGKIIIVP